MSNGVTVVILTRDRLALLRQTLDALSRGSRPPDEVVLVESGCEDAMADCLKAVSVPFPVRRLPAPEGSWAEARNAGWEAAQGPWILYLDDDVEPDRFLLERLLEGAEQRGLDAAGAAILPAQELEAPAGYAPEMGWAAGLMDEGIFGPLAGRRHLPSTSALLLRRSVLQEFPFQQIGGEFGRAGHDYAAGREDAELWRRLRRAGRPTAVIPRALAWHHVQQDRLELARLRDRARADGQAQWVRERHPQDLRPAACDVVHAPLAAARQALAGERPWREAWARHRLWAVRQAALLRAAVDDYSAEFSPTRRLGLFLRESARAALGLAKAALRTVLVRAIRSVYPCQKMPIPADRPQSLLLVLHPFVGDAILALPMVQQLAAAFPPTTTVHLLAGDFVAELLRANVPPNVKVHAPRPEAAGAGPRAAWNLWRQLRRLRPDAVLVAYVHGLGAAPLFLLGAPVAGWGEDNGFQQQLWAALLDQQIPKNFFKAEAAALGDLLEPFGVAGNLFRPQLQLPTTARDRPARWLAEAGTAPGRYAVLNVEAEDREKNWPVDRWAALADRIHGAGMAVFLVGGRTGRQAWEPFAAQRPWAISLHQLGDAAAMAWLLRDAALFAGGDSGPSHLAQSAGCPSVLLFGGSDRPRWEPLPRLRDEANPPNCAIVSGGPGDWLEEETRGLPRNQGLRLLGLDAVWRELCPLLGAQENAEARDKTH